MIGSDEAHARAVLAEIYRPLYLNEPPILYVSRRTAELIKYAANAFLDSTERYGSDVRTPTLAKASKPTSRILLAPAFPRLALYQFRPTIRASRNDRRSQCKRAAACSTDLGSPLECAR